jgi:hypothetical protein
VGCVGGGAGTAVLASLTCCESPPACGRGHPARQMPLRVRSTRDVLWIHTRRGSVFTHRLARPSTGQPKPTSGGRATWDVDRGFATGPPPLVLQPASHQDTHCRPASPPLWGASSINAQCEQAGALGPPLDVGPLAHGPVGPLGAGPWALSRPACSPPSGGIIRRCPEPRLPAGRLVHWPAGRSVHWPAGRSVHWPAGRSVHWPAGRSVH